MHKHEEHHRHLRGVVLLALLLSLVATFPRQDVQAQDGPPVKVVSDAGTGNLQATVYWTEPNTPLITKWQYQYGYQGAIFSSWIDVPNSYARTYSHTVTEMNSVGLGTPFKVPAVIIDNDTYTHTPVPPTSTNTHTPVPPTATHTHTPVPSTATHTHTPTAGSRVAPPTNTHIPPPGVTHIRLRYYRSDDGDFPVLNTPVVRCPAPARTS